MRFFSTTLLVTSMTITLLACSLGYSKKPLDPSTPSGLYANLNLCTTLKVCPPAELSNKDFLKYYFLSPIAKGTIQNTDIYLTVPYRTNLTALVANYMISGNKVFVGEKEQENGVTANDFSQTVEYAIEAKDRTRKNYKVRTNLASRTDKEITEFWFESPRATGYFLENTIRVNLPFGTDTSSLKAFFITTGDSVNRNGVNQVAGETLNNFSNTINYTVVAADGSTKNYEVDAIVSSSDSKSIDSFSFASLNVNGTITGNTIQVLVPVGTNLTTLIPSFRFTGKKVKIGETEQVSGVTVNNFTNPITYTIVADDNSTIDYLVSVSFPNLDAKDITYFAIQSPFTTGVINGTDITVSLSSGTDKTALTVLFTTTGAKVTVNGTPQTSGIGSINFSIPVYYTVTAIDKTMKRYKITVNN